MRKQRCDFRRIEQRLILVSLSSLVSNIQSKSHSQSLVQDEDDNRCDDEFLSEEWLEDAEKRNSDFVSR